MTLDDFFTLTEMNNGLTSPSRVKELVDVMQKEGDCSLKNVADATRQWSAVASVIAATENKGCLDLFIQLNGLHFIDKWLKDAQKFNNDLSDSFVEESMTHLLRALGKLHVEYEKLVDSEIWTTIKDLLMHTSSKVQDRARALFESWTGKRDGDASHSNAEQFGALTDLGKGSGLTESSLEDAGKSASISKGSGHSESSLKDAYLSSGTSGKEKGQEPVTDDPVQSVSSADVHLGQVVDMHNSDKKFNPTITDNGPLELVSSSSTKLDAAFMVPCQPAVSVQKTLDGRTELNEMESPSDIKNLPEIQLPPEKLVPLQEVNPSEEHFQSSCNAAEAMESVKEASLQKRSVADDKRACDKGSNDSTAMASQGKDSMNDRDSTNQCRISSTLAAKEGVESNHLMLSDFSGDAESLEKSMDLAAFLSGSEENGKMNKLGIYASKDNMVSDHYFAKREMDRPHNRAGRKSDVELDYGIVDPLEVARQVAIEVEREVVQDREQSCSSSDGERESNIRQPDGPELVSEQQSDAIEGSSREVEGDPYLSAEASPMQDESATSTENLEAEQTDDIQDMDTSQVTKAAQEEANPDKGLFNFDLNQEISSEDADHPGNQASPLVSVVSASRAAAAPGQPFAPLQFEGNLGWKGSAATSAFRPASPRRVPESDKDHSISGGSSSSKQRQGCLDIDLNVADRPPDKHVHIYSGLPSGESSVETNSRKSGRLELDLNHASEDSIRPSDWRMGQFFPQGNGHHRRSHSSSSSSKQPSLRNIDLNDQPSLPNDSSDNSYLSKISQNLNACGGIKSDDSVISILGTRVEVRRKDSVSQTLPSPNGRTSELAFDVNMGRPGHYFGPVIPYTNYDYNEIAPEPAMPFSSPLYGSGGPIPYMVDSRGAPIFPQIVGSSSALPPFFLNMTGTTPPNGFGPVGPHQGSSDLNCGMMVDGGSRDPGGFTQFLTPGLVRPLDEQLRSSSQSTISSPVGGKRKEPDNGFENYPFNRYTPPWK